MMKTPIGLGLRPLAAIAALGALLALGACQSMLPTGAGAGASADAHLAAIRSSRGLPELTADARLERAALKQSGYMVRAGQMSHTAQYGFAARMREGGVEGAAAENIAHGGMDMARLFDMWMKSPGHRRNMLDPRFHHYGLASAEDASGRKYWTLVLGR